MQGAKPAATRCATVPLPDARGPSIVITFCGIGVSEKNAILPEIADERGRDGADREVWA